MFRVLVSFLWFATVCQAQDLGERLRQIADEFAAGDRFSGSVLVAQGDTILLDRSYGLANHEWSIANTPDTKFRIGSITKQFTAAAILLLQERGRLTLDDAVSRHLPDTPAAWEKITLRHLLTHTSGIPSFTDLPEYPTWKREPATPALIVARVRGLPLEFTPGTQFRYSNSGYLLLGHVIEWVARQSYETFLTENVLRACGMADSGYDSQVRILPRRASGYVPMGSALENAPYIDMRVPHAAGGLYSTTHDLLTWHRALFGGTLLSAASLESMLTPAREHYALGLAVRQVRKRTVIQHGGGIEGFSCFAAYVPDLRLSLIALSNVNGPAADQLVARLGGAVMDDEARRSRE